MKKAEQQLFWSLCRYRDSDPRLAELAGENATPEVLGHLFFNRMAGVAYGVLESARLLGKVSREFRNAIGAAWLQNREKNNSYFSCIRMLSEVLAPCRDRYAMLKGAALCRWYPDGYRTSNDIDLLVAPEDVSRVGRVLSDAGFLQGSIRNGEFVPASREEIISSKMLRGETVPYFLRVDLPYLPYLEVDVNFSLDYKNSDDTVLSDMLQGAGEVLVKDLRVRTLSRPDFLLHLCGHLYKEATTMPWVRMHRDMTLYKYCDIYGILSELDLPGTERLFARASELGMSELCAYVILCCDGLLRTENRYAVQAAEETLKGRTAEFDRVLSPADGKWYRYPDFDLKKRFFARNRAGMLKEERHEGLADEST